MGLLDKPRITPVTLKQKQDDVSITLRRDIYRMYHQLSIQHASIIEQVWANRSGLTPQQVLDAMGTDAADMFVLSLDLVGLVEKNKPGSMDLSMVRPYAINADGTVTIK